MQYFIKVHIQTGLIQGYLEKETLKQLHSVYRNKSDQVCDICLRENESLDSEQINVSIFPIQIIAIESKLVC